MLNLSAVTGEDLATECHEVVGDSLEVSSKGERSVVRGRSRGTRDAAAATPSPALPAAPTTADPAAGSRDGGSGCASGRGRREAPEGEGDAHRPALARSREVVARDVGDAPQSVAHGVGVHEEDPRRRLERPTVLEVGGRRLEEWCVTGRGQRSVDAVDEDAAGRGVAGEGSFGQHGVRLEHARRIGPGGRGREPAQGGACRASGREEVRDGRPEHDRSGPEAVRDGLDDPRRLTGAAEDRDEPRALDDGERLDPVLPDRPAQVVDGRYRSAARGGGAADDERHVCELPPPERAGPRLHGVVGLAAQDGVDDERLEPGVPRTTGLGRAGVDLRGGEGDLAGEAQHRLAQQLLVAGGGQALDPRLDDVDDGPHEVERLAQADRSGQLLRRVREDRDGGRWVALLLVEPRDELRDAGLGDEPDLRALLGREVAVPPQVLLHALGSERRELAGAALDGARRRLARVLPRSAHGPSLGVRLPRLCMPLTNAPAHLTVAAGGASPAGAGQRADRTAVWPAYVRGPSKWGREAARSGEKVAR